MKSSSMSRSKRWVLACSITAVFGGAAIAGHLSAQPIAVSALDVQADMNGTYVLRKSTMDDENNARTLAIRRAIAKVDEVSRKRWAAMLELSSLPALRIDISNTATEIAIALGDRPALKTPSTGIVRPLTEDQVVRQQVEGDELVQRVSSAALAGVGTLSLPLQTVIRHVLNKDGSVLTVETEISGGALQGTIAFSTTYDRL